MTNVLPSFLSAADVELEGVQDLRSAGVTFSLQFIGSLPMCVSISTIDQHEWQHVGRVCILRVLRADRYIEISPDLDLLENLFTDEKPEIRKMDIEMNVSVESILLISSTESLQVLKHFSMDDISCVIPGSQEVKNYFCLFAKVKNETNGIEAMKRRCYVFYAGAAVTDVRYMVAQAFKIRQEQQIVTPTAPRKPPPRNYSRDQTPTPPSRTNSQTFLSAETPTGPPNTNFDFSYDDSLPPGRRTRATSSQMMPPPAVPLVRPSALEPNVHVRYPSENTKSNARNDGTPPPLPPRIRSNSTVRAPDLPSPSSRRTTPDSDGTLSISDDEFSLASIRGRSHTMAVNLDQHQFGNITRNLHNEVWFHGILSREAAESRLTKDGQFLVRQSSNIPGQIVLTGRENGLPKHICLIDQQGRLITSEGNFSTISQLIEHYKRENLPVSSATSMMYLKTPVTCPGTFHSNDGHVYTTIQ
ncbi:SHC-transforming protein 1 isoform X2 [Aphelenchoides besseyi]|nr:SHC-transforming protein 1 isoform X2 [Aphelenchoides besseyi]